MIEVNKAAPIRAKLFYKSTCPPCQWMSKLAVLFSLGTIHRIPISSEEAKALYSNHPDKEGQLILQLGQTTIFGPWVFAAVPRCILWVWWRLFTYPFSYKSNQKTKS